MSFTGYPKGAVGFLNDLKENNNREWFAENKSDYEDLIKFPSEQFAAEMATSLGEMTGHDYGSKIFRIYRDVRFSKDKTPYNAWVHMIFMPKIDNAGAPGWFFALEPDKIVLGSGVFRFDKGPLSDFRDRVVSEEGAELTKIVNNLLAKGNRMNDPPLKRVPTGYPKDHEREALLRRKGLAIWKDIEDTSIATKTGFVEHCSQGYTELRRLFDWLMGE